MQTDECLWVFFKKFRCLVVLCQSNPTALCFRPSSTPPAGHTSPSPTPPDTPFRRGNFTRLEYDRRHQLKIMDNFDKMLQEKLSSHGRSSGKKSRSRPRSMTREETKLSLSPAKGTTGTETIVFMNVVQGKPKKRIRASPSSKTIERPIRIKCSTKPGFHFLLCLFLQALS